MLPISVCMIVKNESAVIERCLGAVARWAEELVVVDTGSTDDTLERAAGFSTARVHRRGFVDFSEARNASLELATRDWILVLDADEWIAHGSENELARALQSGRDHHALWRINFLSGGGMNLTPITRLIRRAAGYRYEKSYGESLNYAIMRKHGLTTVHDEIDVAMLHDGYLLEDERRLRRKLEYGVSHGSAKLAAGEADDADLYYLCLNLSHLGRHAEADAVSREPAQARPDSHLLGKFRCLLHLLRGEWQEGDAWYERVIRRHPTDYALAMMHAKSLARRGEIAAACARFEEIRAAYTCHVGASLNLLRLHGASAPRRRAWTPLEEQCQAELDRATALAANAVNAGADLLDYRIIDELLHA